MKQTRKLFRSEREFLEKRKIDTNGVRVICHTNEIFKAIRPDGTILIVDLSKKK